MMIVMTNPTTRSNEDSNSSIDKYNDDYYLTFNVENIPDAPIAPGVYDEEHEENLTGYKIYNKAEV